MRNEIAKAKELLVNKGVAKGQINNMVKNTDKYFDDMNP